MTSLILLASNNSSLERSVFSIDPDVISCTLSDCDSVVKKKMFLTKFCKCEELFIWRLIFFCEFEFIFRVTYYTWLFLSLGRWCCAQFHFLGPANNVSLRVSPLSIAARRVSIKVAFMRPRIIPPERNIKNENKGHWLIVFNVTLSTLLRFHFFFLFFLIIFVQSLFPSSTSQLFCGKMAPCFSLSCALTLDNVNYILHPYLCCGCVFCYFSRFISNNLCKKNVATEDGSCSMPKTGDRQ